MALDTAPPRAEYLDYTPATRWIIMGAIMLGTLMQMIDTSIVNVAIPTMMGNLGASIDQISWVTTGYILANVITLPLTGWLSSVFGRRKFLAGSMALFTAASFFCGLSNSLGMLVFFRILQGVGGAALISTAQATMMEIFPPQQLAMVQALYGLGVMVGPTVGPTLGGWITDNYSWPWIFYINVPIGIVATLFTLSFMRDSSLVRKRGSVDIFGIALLAIGLGSLQMLLEKGQKEGWFESSYIIGLTVCAVVALIAFVIWEMSIEHPVINLRVLRHRGFAAGTLFGLVVGFGLYGGMFILPVFLQQLQHHTAQQSGIIMLPGAIATAFAMPIIGKLTSKYPPRILTAIGVIGAVISMFLMRHLTMDTSPYDLFWPLVLRGASLGFLFVPLSLATLAGLRGHEMGEGAALFNLSRQLGGSAGIAFLATFLTNRVATHASTLAEHVNCYNPAALLRLSQYKSFFMAKGFAAPVAEQQALLAMNGVVKQQAALIAYSDCFAIMGVLFLSTLLLLFLFEKSSPIMQKAAPPAGGE
jgi:DHA2 family multidrug resistance protein